MTSMFLMIGATELLLIAGIALLLFGGKKLPELMRGMGQGMKSFKEGLNSPIEEPEKSGEKDKDMQQNAQAQTEQPSKIAPDKGKDK